MIYYIIFLQLIGGFYVIDGIPLTHPENWKLIQSLPFIVKVLLSLIVIILWPLFIGITQLYLFYKYMTKKTTR